MVQRSGLFWGYILYLLVIIICFSSCMRKLEISTNSEKIHVTTVVLNVTNLISDLKKICKENDVKQNIEVLSDDTSFVKVELYIKGFDQANSLMTDVATRWEQVRNNEFKLKFIKSENYNSVDLKFNTSFFLPDADLVLSGTSELFDIVPEHSTSKLSIYKVSKNKIEYKIQQNSRGQPDQMEEVSYRYKNTNKLFFWEVDNWVFVCTILGGIVSLATILGYFIRKK